MPLRTALPEEILSSIRSWAREPLLLLPNVQGAGAMGWSLIRFTSTSSFVDGKDKQGLTPYTWKLATLSTVRAAREEQQIVSEKKTLGSYDVGYGKPPKNTQFQKGLSGTPPRGRPKRCLDVDHELIRESKSFMTVNENGRRKRISKHEVIVKQVMKQAMIGSIQA
jgi:hypothetical protein